MIENPYKSPASTGSVGTGEKPTQQSFMLLRIFSALSIVGGLLLLYVKIHFRLMPDDHSRLELLQDLLGGAAVLGGLITFGFAPRLYDWYIDRMKSDKPITVRKNLPNCKQE